MSAEPAITDGSQREALRLAFNALSLFDRASLARSLAGEGGRNLEQDCGYPTGFIPRQQYQDLFDREAVAARVVEVLPKETWRVSPSVYETEDPEEETSFEAALAALDRALRPEASHFQDQEGSPLLAYLARLDVLSGVGQYGVMLLGLDDGLELNQPARLAPGSLAAGVSVAPVRDAYGTWNANGNGKAARKLIFVRVFPESMAVINAFDGDEKSPRFGQPVEYTLMFNDPSQQSTGALGMVKKPVHWTRVLHVADNLASSEVFGVPRMRPVLNRLLDLKKLYGGSAEMYYSGAFPGISIETHPALGGDVEVNKEEIRQMMADYVNHLRRFLALQGQTAKSLSPQVVDPSPQINAQIEAICIQIGVPVRIFKGSERGQLASGQDDDNWNGRVRARQLGHVTPRIIVPFIDRLIALGVLPTPEDGYSVSWPDLATRSDEQKAAIAQQRGAAVVAYGNSAGTQDQLTPTDFYVKVMGFSEAESTALVENADQARAERQAEEAKAAAEQARQAAQDHARQLELAKARQQPPPGPDGPTGPGASGGADGQPPGGGGPGNAPAPGGATANAFCATGEGGGVDPTCSPGGGGKEGAQRAWEDAKRAAHEHAAGADGLETDLVNLHWDHEAVARVHDVLHATAKATFEVKSALTPSLPGRTYVKKVEDRLQDYARLQKAAERAVKAYGAHLYKGDTPEAADHGKVMHVLRRALVYAREGRHKVEAVRSAFRALRAAKKSGGGTQNYDPSQPRLPGGGTGAGRWAPGDALAGLGRLDARRHAGTHGPASDDVDPPFAVTDARPWETAAEGLPEEDATVSLSGLHAVKSRLSARSLRHFAAGGSAGDAPAPRVWLTPDGRQVIEDGVHRLAAERLRGRAEARVRLVRWKGRPPTGNEAGPLTLNADERAALAPEERALWTGLWQERQRLLVRARGLPPEGAAPLLAEADGLRARAGALLQAVRERVAGGQP